MRIISLREFLKTKLLLLMFSERKCSLTRGSKGHFDPRRCQRMLASLCVFCINFISLRIVANNSSHSFYSANSRLQILLLSLTIGAVFGSIGPAKAAVGVESLGFYEHRSMGITARAVDDDYYWSSEFSGRNTERHIWPDSGSRILKRPLAPDSDGTLILESFSTRNRTVEPFIARSIAFEGVFLSGPILTLTSPIEGKKIQRLSSRPAPRVSAVPLPPTLPLLAGAMAGIFFAGRRKKLKAAQASLG